MAELIARSYIEMGMSSRSAGGLLIMRLPELDTAAPPSEEPLPW